MNKFFKVCFTFMVFCFISLTLYFELGLLITKSYTTAFIDPFEPINIYIMGFLAIACILAIGLINIRSRRNRLFFISASSVLITVLTFMNLSLLDKSNKIVYRQDLGLHAYYLYLDNETGKYILEYVAPLSKSTILGHYNRTGSKILLDKDFVTALNLKGSGYNEPQTSLDLQYMQEVK